MIFSKSTASKFGVLLIAASITTASSLLASSVTEVSLAQQTTTKPILSTPCVDNTIKEWGSRSWRNVSEDISINRQVFTSTFYIVARKQPGGFACKINSGNFSSKFKSLKLEFGIPDGKPMPTTVNVYSDGNQVATKTISGGEKGTLIVDVSKTRSIAFEVISEEDDKSVIYFIDASLSKNPVAKTP